ncbi:hypothetical protein PHYSODRAFT_529700 [Phytophthora sojae]|uniref:DDE-1 domain-containing protein n=1 Tax=Phytophthora sojae (strain P6497) TaxID=1094619 RepID=G5ACT4_PHYSP|nr:hypothetical protein PHYSODRAFT_529700 [Phytophthora sojae]EGZ07158.1 hypothetical protein PHYSODRAFT_529700 [Phytophthora sojae]|eukprot:XP_009537922.1 hypothetical protein PHYSODRAFT_529700 [Phytophthora sojae]
MHHGAYRFGRRNNFSATLCLQWCPGGDVEKELNKFCVEDVATFSVQESAWFDERVMLEWIEKCRKYIVVETSVLILDSLSVHKEAEIADALACTGTLVLYVPGGCTGVAQPLDVGVMGPVKQHIRRINSSRSVGRPKTVTPAFRRHQIFERAMEGLRCVSALTDRMCNGVQSSVPIT